MFLGDLLCFLATFGLHTHEIPSCLDKCGNKLGWFSSREILVIKQQVVPLTQRRFLVFQWTSLLPFASHLCMPPSDTQLHITLRCGLSRLLPFSNKECFDWGRGSQWEWLSKEARPRMRGHPTSWQFVSLETMHEAGILRGCPEFENFPPFPFLRTQIKQRLNFARVSESNTSMVNYLSKVTCLFTGTTMELQKGNPKQTNKQKRDICIRIAYSLEKSQMLGKTEGRRRGGHQRLKWLDGIKALCVKMRIALGVKNGTKYLVYIHYLKCWNLPGITKIRV